VEGRLGDGRAQAQVVAGRLAIQFRSARDSGYDIHLDSLLRSTTRLSLPTRRPRQSPGWSQYGQVGNGTKGSNIGDGTKTNRSTPVRVSALSNGGVNYSVAVHS
jgi:hypothetical protein